MKECNSLLPLIDLYLDRELSPDETARIQEHLDHCHSCQSIFLSRVEFETRMRNGIRSTLNEESLGYTIHRNEAAMVNQPEFESEEDRTYPKIFAWCMSIAVAALLLLGISIWREANSPAKRISQSRPIPNPMLARITRTTGPIQVRSAKSNAWSTWDAETLHEVGPEVCLSTGESMCELVLDDGTTMRLNRSTECVVHSSQEATLENGSAWIKTTNVSMQINLPKKPDPKVAFETEKNNENLMVFACPRGATVQCRVSGSGGQCQSLSDQPLNLSCGSATATIPEMGELIANWEGENAPTIEILESQEPDQQLQSICWQLPLLAVNSAEDEFIDLLLRMLPNEPLVNAKIAVADTKLSMFYDSQIRMLGWRGAVPLFTFVQSESSIQVPMKRKRAMEIACELANEKSLAVLGQLTKDKDEAIAEKARETIARISEQNEPLGDSPG